MPATATQTPGIVDTFGGKFVDVIDWTGPTSYTNGTGEKLAPSTFGCPNSLIWAEGSVSVSGTYRGVCRKAAAGAYGDWYFQVVVMSSGAEVTNATNLSAEKFKIMGLGV